MEAELLRLVLLSAGICLILGIYLWDRYKRTSRRGQALDQDDLTHDARPMDADTPLSEEWRASAGLGDHRIECL